MNKTINVNQAKTGMVIAADVLNNANQIVLNKGTILNEKNITRLKFYSIEEISIKVKKGETEAKGNNTSASAETATFTESVKLSPEFQSFSGGYSAASSELKAQVTNIIKSPDKLDADLLLENIKCITNNFKSSSSFFDMLACIRDNDDAIYSHCMNLAIMCSAFADWLKLSKEDKEVLIISGMMCDIGKLSIPAEILNKKGALSEEEFKLIREHTIRGYNTLKKHTDDIRIANAALMHHERCDGSGYPKGLKASEVDDFAKIIAILDVYDAMTAARAYRGPVCPLEVLGQFQDDGLTKYDPQYLLMFMDKVSSSYLHQDVILSDGRIGQIVLLNKNKPASPIVRLTDGTAIDLSTTPDIKIIGLA